MKSRAEIKTLARASLRERYWLCVGAFFLFGLLLVGLALTYVGFFILLAPLSTGFLFLSIAVFRGDSCDMGTMFRSAFQNFGRKLGGFWWMYLFLILWCLIPLGVMVLAFSLFDLSEGLATVIVMAAYIIVYVKLFSYVMTMCILSDCPNVKAKDALRLSIRMMRGHKWELFVFYLSFIGWGLLSALTLGILYIFWTGPYMVQSFAGYYLELREDCLRRGIITTDELDGGPVAYN